ncbi:MAG: hypothetical protein IPP63_09655 [Chloracidobacterium sp.]|nr:hypothetical protein [Chloracidobacterium sp.]MBL0240345.1 hypothetical protein [Chloracidobacterium sp.]
MTLIIHKPSVFALLGLLLFVPPCFGQITGDKDFVASHSLRVRENLNAQIDMFVALNKKRKWEELYKILYEPLGKEKFIKQRKQSMFYADAFDSRKAVTPDPNSKGWVMVFGCVTVSYGDGSVERLKGFMHAYLENDLWLLTDIEFLRKGVHSPPDKCEEREAE